MDTLLSSINELADKQISEQNIINTNIDKIMEDADFSEAELNESVTTWLARVRGSVNKGSIDPDKKESVVKILGALLAMSNPDLADALDEKGNLGTILFNVASNVKKESNDALHKLLEIGNHPSVRAFVDKVNQIIDDPGELDILTKDIQAKIEPIMNKRRSNEKRRQYT